MQHAVVLLTNLLGGLDGGIIMHFQDSTVTSAASLFIKATISHSDMCCTQIKRDCLSFDVIRSEPTILIEKTSVGLLLDMQTYVG